MKVAVIADTHLPRGSRRLPDECVRRLESAELILHAGDFSELSVLRELEQLAPVLGVLGNNDDAELGEILPRSRVAEIGGVRIAIVHEAGARAGRARRLVGRFAGCEAVVYAHTHVAEVTREDGVWVLNPGSPTERRRSPARSMLELVVAEGELRPKVVTLSP